MRNLKNNNRKKFWLYGVFTSMGLLMLFFNNCKGSSEQAIILQSQAPSSAANSTNPTNINGTLCEQDIKNLYARGWQKFLITNCQTCHSNGPGKGRFAHADTNIAYAEFEEVGYVKISNNAISTSHNPPYTGIQHTQAVNDLKLEWQMGLQDYAKCTGTDTTVTQESQASKITLKSTAQTIGLANDGDKQVFTWTINSDLTRIAGSEALPNIPNGKFSITVNRYKNSSGFTYYTFTSPTIHGATVDTHIEGIFIRLNGLLLNYPTTFSYINTNVRSGTANDLSGLISTGGLVAPKLVLPTDQVEISFINIAPTVLPAPAPPLSVNLLGSKTTIVPKGTSFIDLSIGLSAAASEPIIVTLSENNNLCGTASTLVNSNTLFKVVSSTCLPDIYNVVCPGGTCATEVKNFGRARSDVGATYKRYDWDYKFPVNSVTFKVGETSKTLRVYFSKDIRYEQNRVLTLDIASTFGPVNIGANKNVNYIINKYDNPVPSGAYLTFSELMNPNSGILGQNCTACHNSKDLAGSYDMTDYDLMIANQVLIPGDVNSKMFLRMNPTPDYLGKPMPLDGFLTPDKRLEVQLWIQAGAPNN